mmetsp:Transcript_35058/g.51486  ORF Transcript_35058/g.51486 Transcript_35058/m.51486 type:complete len:749 (-) Transcript_35058:575-2821(-)|eukprot:CAMPEP_0195528642 /NCGR_PEP_ID=MMETSP0794_2-20130614/30872_1 /TAXON_ID=515487 /ORGANISM="Stephanopyxis turris, Strain CCMP 815" /LENGTH=748 /DNA_ID=CAMNT_0040659807 /DNA_START=85 /DNA_END=2331 /DNA_ORIENTATION=+
METPPVGKSDPSKIDVIGLANNTDGESEVGEHAVDEVEDKQFCFSTKEESSESIVVEHDADAQDHHVETTKEHIETSITSSKNQIPSDKILESIMVSTIRDVDLEVEIFKDLTYKIVGPDCALVKLKESCQLCNQYEINGHSPFEGAVAPPFRIELSDAIKTKFCIPPKATKAVYLYPMEELEIALESIEVWKNPWAFVLLSGAIVYLDDMGGVLSVNALTFTEMNDQCAGIVLVGPYTASPEALTELRETNRFHRIHYRSILDAGFRSKCHVGPEEKFANSTIPLCEEHLGAFGSFVYEYSNGNAVVYTFLDKDRTDLPPFASDIPTNSTTRKEILLGQAVRELRKRAEEAAHITEQAGDFINIPTATEVEEAKKRKFCDFSKMATYRYFLFRALLVIIYLFIGYLVYVYGEQRLTTVQSLYFTIVTMSTVGYGDISPDTGFSRVFTAFYILVGIAIIFHILGEAFEIAMSVVETKVQYFMDYLFYHDKLAISESSRIKHEEIKDGRDSKLPRWYFYTRELLFYTLFGFLLTQVFCAWIYTIIQPELTYGDAMWLCWVTATTVGYGDVLPETDSARGWACVQILLSVSWLAGFLDRFAAAKKKRAYTKKRRRMLQMQLDENLIEQLDISGTGAVTRAEFIAGMLIAMGAEVVGTDLNWDDHIKPLVKRFEALDADGNGKLTKEDLEFMVEESKRQAKEDGIGVDDDEDMPETPRGVLIGQLEKNFSWVEQSKRALELGGKWKASAKM